MQLDDLDRTATTAFEGYVVRKDLVRTFSRQFPVPTYVVEFLLGRYCATTDEAEIQEGLHIVQRQLDSRTVKAGEEELFKAHARESGSVKIIDIITARLDARTDSYVATLPSLRLTDVRLTPAMVTDNERMLTGGFYAEMTLSYDASIAQEKGGRPFGVDSLRAIQLSKREVLDVLTRGRQDFTTSEWRDLLLRSVGFEPDTLAERAKDALLLRMVPFVERILNNPVPAAVKESIRCAEQNLYARAQQLVGDRDPRAHEFSVQLRGFDAARSGAKTAVAALIALSSALLKKSVRGGLVVVGEVTLGGIIEPIHNAVTLAELAVEKGAKSLLLPVACRRQLFDLSDEMATKLDIEFYQDGRDALLKALVD